MKSDGVTCFLIMPKLDKIAFPKNMANFRAISFLTVQVLFYSMFFSSAWSQELLNATGDTRVTVLYSGNTLEEIKPCGCTKEADFGGLLRRASFISKERKTGKNILLLDAGDNLRGNNPQGPLKADLIAEALKSMDYDAVIPGEKDFKYGSLFFKTGGFNGWLASNLLHNDIQFKKIVTKDFAGVGRFGIMGLIDDSLFDRSIHSGLSIQSPADFLRKDLRSLIKKNKIDFPILLMHSGKRRLSEKIFETFPEFRIVITGHTDDPDNEDMKEPIIRDGRGLFFADNRGRRLGKINIEGKLKKESYQLKHTWIPLDETIEDDASLEPFFDKYKREVKALFFRRAALRKKIKETTPYVSSGGCVACHEEITKKWKETPHARALETLKRVEQSYDAECIKCHVTGFEKEGYVSDKVTPDLGGVQCESCHGPGKAHSRDVDVKYGQVTRKTCLQCHTKSKDPKFSYQSYWKRVQH